MSNPGARALYISIGCLSVGLGAIGAVVPGMPTTVFLIVASYCFARSSPRLDAWLHDHRWLGPTLRRYRQTGGMTRRAKTTALLSMWTGVSLSLLALGNTGRLVTISLGLIGTVVIVWVVKEVEP